MPHINVELSAEAIRDINVTAAMLGITQKAFILNSLAAACKFAMPAEEFREKYIAPAVHAVIESDRNSHNPKTCRVYRCAQCIALGKKF